MPRNGGTSDVSRAGPRNVLKRSGIVAILAKRAPAEKQQTGRLPTQRAGGMRRRPSGLAEDGQICVMSRSLVSGRKISATTKLIAATTIGYHRPE